MKHFPVRCPCCDDHLDVIRLSCQSCETEVAGEFPLPQLALLSPADQSFVLQFILTSGSLKEMAHHLGVSYPTVRNRLNEIIETLQSESND